MVIHSAAPVTFNFASSNDLINEIHKNITWGQRGNMHSVPTDCPQRDERLGWMGDAQIFAPTASYNMDMSRFFKKWMYDISDCQRDDGAVHDVNPAIVVSGPAKPGWGDAVNVIPWVVYQFYGDKRIIEENYDAMVNWVGYMSNQSKDYLYERSGYGDWIAVVESPKEPIGAAYFYYSTKLLAKMAGIIGKKDDEIKYNNLAEKIAHAFQKKFFDEESGQYKGATQTANLLPLAFGITPYKFGQRVVKNIVKDVKAKGNHPSTGFLGTAYLLPILSQYGEHELAYKVASQKKYPSWGYMVEKDATTIWELWNSDTQGPGMNSRNHFALGSVGEWFYGWLAGIRPDIEVPGFKRTIIAPRPVGDLNWVKCEFESVYGSIRSDWEVKEGELEMKVTIPSNTTALIHIPVLDTPWSTIEESGRILIQNGEPVTTIEDLRLVETNDQATIFETGSGDYKFVAK
jgi:alpha-L-rhamnosidase